MHDRHDLTDVEWALLEPLLPTLTPRRSRPWKDHRTVVNGVLWRTRTGSPWRDLPESYGRWKTVYNRHRRWSADGTWAEVLSELQRGCDVGEERWVVAIDSTVVRAHHHASGAVTNLRPMCRRGCWRWRWPRTWPQRRLRATALRPSRSVPQGAGSNHTNSQLAQGQLADREALGRSRGGLRTKIHLLADARCRPLRTITTAGQRHDSLVFELLMDDLCVKRPGPGPAPPTPRRAARGQGVLQQGHPRTPS